ncbi:hypothetical protein KAT51_00670 [bacterium]|nr:hypothetical protein [bacterium]
MKKWLIVLMCLTIVGCAQTKKEKKGSFKGEKTVVKSHYEKGIAYLKEDFIIDAKREFEKAIKENPANINAHWQLAFLYKKQNYTGLAIKEFEKVIALNPRIIKARYEVGNYYLGGGEYKKAKNQFQEILRIKPDEKKAQRLLSEVKKAMARVAKEQEMAMKLGGKTSLVDRQRTIASQRKQPTLSKKMEGHLGQTFDREIQLGMTDKQVRRLWGEPDRINTTVEERGVYEEEWIYGGVLKGTVKDTVRYFRLYFENGILTSWQQ